MVNCAFVIFFSYLIGGYSTTDILRLTKGKAPKQLDSLCRCPCCGGVIPEKYQFPIISYFVIKGKCCRCNNRIPLVSIILEFIVTFVMCLIGMMTGFSYMTFICGFIIYQVIKFIVIVVKGRQEESFVIRLVQSLTINFAIFSLGAFLSIIMSKMTSLIN